MNEKVYLTADQITPVKCEMSCQETAINYLRTDDIATITVSDNTTLTKLKKLVVKDPDHWKCYIGSRSAKTGAVTSYIFEVPKKCISFRTVPPKRELTDEQRQVSAERMRLMHEKRKKGQVL